MRRLLLAAGVVAAVAAALLLLHSMNQLEPPVGGVEQPSGGEGLRVAYLLRLEVEGAGRLLVNGTPTALVSSAKPFTAVIEAVPEACYTLRQLLVNGTPVEGARLELLVAGNTTVRAVFERPLHAVELRANVPATALVNGSRVELPATAWVKACEVLVVEPLAPAGYTLRHLLVNGAPLLGSTVLVDGNLIVEAVFERVLYRVRVEASVPGARLGVNGAVAEAPVELEACYGCTVEVAVDDLWLRVNETHTAFFDHLLLRGELAPAHPLLCPNCTICPDCETRLRTTRIALQVFGEGLVKAVYNVLYDAGVTTTVVDVDGTELVVYAGCPLGPPRCPPTPPARKVWDLLELDPGRYFIILPHDWVRVRVYIYTVGVGAYLLTHNPPQDPYYRAEGVITDGVVVYVVVEFTREPYTCKPVDWRFAPGYGGNLPFCYAGLGSDPKHGFYTLEGIPNAISMRTIIIEAEVPARVKIEVERG